MSNEDATYNSSLEDVGVVSQLMDFIYSQSPCNIHIYLSNTLNNLYVHMYIYIYMRV